MFILFQTNQSISFVVEINLSILLRNEIFNLIPILLITSQDKMSILKEDNAY